MNNKKFENRIIFSKVDTLFHFFNKKRGQLIKNDELRFDILIFCYNYDF